MKVEFCKKNNFTKMNSVSGRRKVIILFICSAFILSSTNNVLAVEDSNNTPTTIFDFLGKLVVGMCTIFNDFFNWGSVVKEHSECLSLNRSTGLGGMCGELPIGAEIGRLVDYWKSPKRIHRAIKVTEHMIIGMENVGLDAGYLIKGAEIMCGEILVDMISYKRRSGWGVGDDKIFTLGMLTGGVAFGGIWGGGRMAGRILASGIFVSGVLTGWMLSDKGVGARRAAGEIFVDGMLVGGMMGGAILGDEGAAGRILTNGISVGKILGVGRMVVD